MPERFTETLRAVSEAGWSRAVQHRFVNELFAGAGENDPHTVSSARKMAATATQTPPPPAEDRSHSALASDPY